MNQLKQTQELLEKMEAFQKELEDKEVSGESGTGLVKVRINCKGFVKSIKIDGGLLVPSEVEILEDLIVAAYNDARRKADALVEEESRKLTLGLPKIPGLSF
ncbi:MAG: YbaB/EbfC family nucleoid-associated protein [Holosporales bacterium]|jgi:DNA-binding YbaB/EbfC family protein|nr:YbaB/EbfC family nucleoid-associated protein [Holosporales bacterium]